MANGISIPEGREAAVPIKFTGNVGPRAGVDGELTVDNEEVADAKMEHGHVVVRAKKTGQTAVRYKVEHPEDDSGERDLEAVMMVSVTGEDDDAGWPSGVSFDTDSVHYDVPKRHRGKTERQKRREAAEKEAEQGGREAETDRRAGPGDGDFIDPNRRTRTGLGEDEDPNTERAAGGANTEGQRPLDPKGEIDESEVATQGAGAPRGGTASQGALGEQVPSAARIQNPSAAGPQQPGPRIAPRDSASGPQARTAEEEAAAKAEADKKAAEDNKKK